MATITIGLAASIELKTAVTLAQTTAGENITAGEPLYLSGSTVLAADNSTAAKATVVGIAALNATSGDTCYYINTVGAIIDGGGNFTQDVHWCVAGVSGAIEEYGDMTTGEYVTYLGYGNADGDLVYDPQITGQTKP